MRKIYQIAAIVLFLFLAALAAVTVQIYRHARDRNRLSDGQIMNRAAIDGSIRNATETLQNLQTYAATYLLTGQAETLKSYRESLQDWQYEIGTLNLLSGPADRATVLRFAETGTLLADEMGAIVSLELAGSHEAAVSRLRTGPMSAYRDKLKSKEKDSLGLNWGHSPIAYNSFKDLHQLIYCAGGLSLLGFMGLGLLLYSLGTNQGAAPEPK